MTIHILSFVFPFKASWSQTPREYSILSLICLTSNCTATCRLRSYPNRFIDGIIRAKTLAV
jgi:hypothetical protein